MAVGEFVRVVGICASEVGDAAEFVGAGEWSEGDVGLVVREGG